MKKIRILVLDGDARQALPFYKSYKCQGHHLTITYTRKLSPGYLSRYPDKKLIFPVCEKQPELFKETLFSHLKSESYDVILPFGHHTIRFCVENKEQLEQYASVPVPELDTFMRAFDKSETMAFCMENNIPCPYTYFPEKEDLESIIARAEFPLWLKPSIGIGAIGQKRLDTPDDLKRTYPVIRKNFGPIILQEYIPHDGSLQIVSHVFLDENSNLCACMVSEKPRFFPLSGGTSTVLVSVDRPEVAEFSKCLFEGIGMTGIADADIIVDPRDGQAKIMEINPRVSCSIKIGFASGIDYADMWLKLAIGKSITKKMEYKKDLHLRNLCQDILWFLSSSMSDKKKTKPSFFKFFGKNIFYQTISFDDPLTFVGFVGNMLCKYSSSKARAEKFGSNRKALRR